MRLPNGYGSVTKMRDKKRRKPFRVRVTQGFDDNRNAKIYKYWLFCNKGRSF